MDSSFSLLPSGHHGPAGIGGHFHGAAIAHAEVGGRDLTAIDERQNEAVGHQGAEFFHEIQGEGRAAGRSTWR